MSKLGTISKTHAISWCLSCDFQVAQEYIFKARIQTCARDKVHLEPLFFIVLFENEKDETLNFATYRGTTTLHARRNGFCINYFAIGRYKCPID